MSAPLLASRFGPAYTSGYDFWKGQDPLLRPVPNFERDAIYEFAILWHWSASLIVINCAPAQL